MHGHPCGTKDEMQRAAAWQNRGEPPADRGEIQREGREVIRLTQVEGDVFHVLPRLARCSFHGCVTDFPYHLAFMNRAFDRQHRAEAGSCEGEKAMFWNLRVLRELYRVLVPGAYAAVFQGSKTYHRLAYAAELAGFEVLPMLCGITGQAMAMGGAVGKLIDREADAERTEVVGTKLGRPGAAKDYSNQAFVRSNTYGGGEQLSSDITAPATSLASDFEGHHSRLKDQLMPVALLLKPLEGGLARNAARWGVAGLNADGAREPADPLVGRVRGGNKAIYGRGGGGEYARRIDPRRWPVPGKCVSGWRRGRRGRGSERMEASARDHHSRETSGGCLLHRPRRPTPRADRS